MARSKPGRNDPCPCGSGKKYKKCCLRHADLAPGPASSQQVERALEARLVADLDDIDELSNRALALTNAGDFGGARRCCDELRQRYPDQPDGLERLAELHHARGDREQALATWRQVRDLFVRTPALQDDDEHARWVDEQIAGLEAG
jgi:tetratricopeptide (TPR) repeat protein